MNYQKNKKNVLNFTFKFNTFFYLYKYNFLFLKYLIIYFITSTIFSWLNPITEKRKNGNANNINTNIFIFKLLNIKLIIMYTKTYHTILIIAVL